MKPKVILDTVNNPIRIVSQSNGAIRYIGSNAVVVLNSAGKVITTWATSQYGYRIDRLQF